MDILINVTVLKEKVLDDPDVVNAALDTVRKPTERNI